MAEAIEIQQTNPKKLSGIFAGSQPIAVGNNLTILK
jgi:hypothetical protein